MSETSSVQLNVNPVVHMVHMIICLLTFGFAFPRAFVENIDPTQIDKRFADARKKQEAAGR